LRANAAAALRHRDERVCLHGSPAIQDVGVLHHAVPETEAGDGELHRQCHRGVAGRQSALVEPEAIGPDLTQRDMLHDLRQEIVQHEPLVMPGQQPSRLLERVHAAGREIGVLLEQRHEAIVQLGEQDVHLRDEEVFVVPVVDDERGAV
jgi:hypothetical protein